jgi:hypothetical protein
MDRDKVRDVHLTTHWLQMYIYVIKLTQAADVVIAKISYYRDFNPQHNRRQRCSSGSAFDVNQEQFRRHRASEIAVQRRNGMLQS